MRLRTVNMQKPWLAQISWEKKSMAKILWMVKRSMDSLAPLHILCRKDLSRGILWYSRLSRKLVCLKRQGKMTKHTVISASLKVQLELIVAPPKKVGNKVTINLAYTEPPTSESTTNTLISVSGQNC